MSEGWTEIIDVLRREKLLVACKLNEAATPEEIAALEAHVGQSLPTSLKAFLSAHNGQAANAKLGLYAGREVLSTKSIALQWDTWRSIDETAMNADCAEFMTSEPPGTIKPMYTNRCWIPLTHDYAGNHVGLDFDPDTGGRRGQVIAYGRDEDQKLLLAPSFEEFLPILIAEIRAADWSFADEARNDVH
jgi:cell wall assembly regulator SMI1